MKYLAALVSLAALAVAEPDASVVVPGVAVHPGLATSYVDRSPQGAPGLYGYGYPALAYGHFIGKREAEPSVVVPGVAVHPGLATSYVDRSPEGAPGLLPYAPYAPYYGAYGHFIGKREAEPSVVVPGVAVHPGLATSFEHRSPQGAPGLLPYAPYYGVYGHYLGKREAEPSVVVPGVAVHPGLATSYVDRSPEGAPGLLPYAPYAPYYGAYGHFIGKREAEPSVVVPGVAAHPGLATSFEHRSPQGAPGLLPYAPYYGVYGYGYF